MRVWLVIGSPSGFVPHIAGTALAAGDRVAVVTTGPSDLQTMVPAAAGRLLIREVDAIDTDDLGATVSEVVSVFGRIDIALTIAGNAIVGHVEELTAGEVLEVFTTNVFDQLTMVRGVLPVLRDQRSGHIIVVSALGGLCEVAGWGVCDATQYALWGLAQALRSELAPLGISATFVEPGLVGADFEDGRMRATANNIDDYQLRPEHDGDITTPPVAGDLGAVAAAIFEVAGATDPPLLLPLSKDALRRLEARLNRIADELDVWRDIAGSALPSTPPADMG
jgi:NAD(P)-dependent dehydrogenase (short-subunit alcohol dehydrogenase family)